MVSAQYKIRLATILLTATVTARFMTYRGLLILFKAFVANFGFPHNVQIIPNWNGTIIICSLRGEEIISIATVLKGQKAGNKRR